LICTAGTLSYSMWHYHYLSTVKGYVAQVGLKVFISTECAISRYNQWASRELLLHQFSGARWLIVGSFNRAASRFQPRPISQRYTWHRLVTANERLQRQRRHPREWAQRSSKSPTIRRHRRIQGDVLKSSWKKINPLECEGLIIVPHRIIWSCYVWYSEEGTGRALSVSIILSSVLKIGRWLYEKC